MWQDTAEQGTREVLLSAAAEGQPDKVKNSVSVRVSLRLGLGLGLGRGPAYCVPQPKGSEPDKVRKWPLHGAPQGTRALALLEMILACSLCSEL